MQLALAALAFLSIYAACFVLTHSVRRRSPGLTAALAAAVLVCVEALLLQALSAGQAVTATALIISHLGLAVGAALAVWFGVLRVPALRLRRPTGPAVWVGTLGALALLAALVYRPNNGDSMTYHLARVVYWIQNQSVRPYPTNIVRQVAFPPGAEYLLLVLQAIARSDRLANLVQFGAWILLVCAAVPLARTFGASRRLSRWAGLLFATTPMALEQASSTQNDLVSAVMAVAIVAACTPFLHRRPRWTAGDLILLAVAIAAGLIVKPTGLVVAAPFLLWGAVCSLRQAATRPETSMSFRLWGAVCSLRQAASLRARRQSLRALPVLALLAIGTAITLAPSWRSEAMPTDVTGTVKPFVYSGFDDLADRALNPLRGILRNVPVPWSGLDVLAPTKTFGCEQAHSLCLKKNLLLINDDTAANPGQMLFLLAAITVALVWWRRLPRRCLAAILCLPAGWLLLHGLVRDNVFVARLQLPLFALAPIGLVAFTGPTWQRRPWPAIGSVCVILLAAIGAIAVTQNGRRPVNPLVMLLDSGTDDFYRLVPPAIKKEQTTALRIIESSGCRRLGLYIGESSPDYPMSWSAVQHGIAVRHVVGPDDWPCLVYSDRGMPPPRLSGAWEERGATGIYVPAE